MKTADQYRVNADNCAVMAQAAETEKIRNALSEWRPPGEPWQKSKIGSTANRRLIRRAGGLKAKGK